MKNSLLNAFSWKLLERLGILGSQFVLQIVLARLLSPRLYGILALMVIFTNLANVFIQSGFSTALVQNKELKEEDYSSVFWVSFTIAILIYIGLFFSAPWIAAFYNMPEIVWPFRVLCLMLLPGALNSVQLAKVSRELDFRKVFYSNVAAIIISGSVSMAMAYLGYGLWALVAQSLLNVSVATIVMWCTVSWHPAWVFNFERIKVLFSFGWKLLVSGLLDTLTSEINGLAIGKFYSAADLGFLNRGKQFPQAGVNVIVGSVQSVMLPAISAIQEDRVKAKSLMRKSIILAAFFMFPAMAGLAGCAKSLVLLLLTDKWLECVVYLQIYCFNFAWWPVHVCNLQAINAMGRSDVFLKLEIIKKIQSFACLGIALYFFDTPVAIASIGLFTAFTGGFFNAYPNKMLLNYSYGEQMKDIAPYFALSACMYLVLRGIEMVLSDSWIIIVVQIIVGIIFYTMGCVVFNLYAYKLVKDKVLYFIRNK